MKKIIFFFFLLQGIVSFGQDIDVRNSSIDFVVTNLGIDVDGHFRKFSGNIKFDPNNLATSQLEVKIVAKSVNTDNGMRDEHLLEEEFFDVGNHPYILFVSDKIEKQDDHFTASGKLTMKGTTKPISIPFVYENGLYSGSFELDRNDYGVGGSGFLDTIGDTVGISIKCKTQEHE